MKRHRGGRGQGGKSSNNDKEKSVSKSVFKPSDSDKEFIEGIFFI